MEAYLLLPLIVLLSVLATLVLAQNPQAAPNRLFALLMASAVLLTASGLIRLTTPDDRIEHIAGATVIPLLGLSVTLLLPLVMAIFLPQRYAQPLVFWAIFAPYLIINLIMLADAALGWQAFYVGLTVNVYGQTELRIGPQSPWVLVAFVAGQLVNLIMLVTVAIRHRQWRAPASTLAIGVLLSLVIGGSPTARQFPIATYLSSLPLYLAFAWVTLRFGLFRPSNVVLEAAIDSLPDSLLILDQEQQVRYANRAAGRLFGETLDRTAPPLPALLERQGLTLERRPDADPAGGIAYLRASDGERTLEVTEVALTGDARAARIMVLRDVTRAERQEAALLAQNAEQRRLLDLVAAMEAPVINVNEAILFVPIVGYLDERRNQALMTKLLEAVYQRRGQLIVIDIAGVPMIDTAVASGLNQTVRALRLLGCVVMLSGISASVAITLTQIGGGLHGAQIIHSLQQALDHQARPQLA